MFTKEYNNIMHEYNTECAIIHGWICIVCLMSMARDDVPVTVVLVDPWCISNAISVVNMMSCRSKGVEKFLFQIINQSPNEVTDREFKTS